MTPWCDFRALSPRDQWVFTREPGPEMGEPSDGLHKVKRCPSCNKRLSLRAVYCVGGEFSHWELPAHKPRVTRAKGPRRRTTKEKRRDRRLRR